MLRLNDPLNTCTANEICRVYAFPIPFHENRFVRWKRSIVSRNMAIIRRCFRILLGNKRPRARANARLYRLPICYSIKQITGMQFKVVPSQSRLHEFRAISHGCTYICIHIRVCVYLCVYTYTCVSNFSFPEESAYPPRKETWLLCNQDSSSSWSRLRWDAENKRTNGIEMEGRYIQSDCPLLSRDSCERIGDRLQITLAIYYLCNGKRINFHTLKNRTTFLNTNKKISKNN